MRTETKWRLVDRLHGLTAGGAAGIFLQYWFDAKLDRPMDGVLLGYCLLGASSLFTLFLALLGPKVPPTAG